LQTALIVLTVCDNGLLSWCSDVPWTWHIICSWDKSTKFRRLNMYPSA